MSTTTLAIEHTVTFRLIHPPGSPEEAQFLQAAAELAVLPGVQQFQIRKQTSSKNPHAFGVTMQFASRSHFDAYSKHPAHVDFVQQRWVNEVADFQVADFEQLTTAVSPTAS